LVCREKLVKRAAHDDRWTTSLFDKVHHVVAARRQGCHPPRATGLPSEIAYRGDTRDQLGACLLREPPQGPIGHRNIRLRIEYPLPLATGEPAGRCGSCPPFGRTWAHPSPS